MARVAQPAEHGRLPDPGGLPGRPRPRRARRRLPELGPRPSPEDQEAVRTIDARRPAPRARVGDPRQRPGPRLAALASAWARRAIDPRPVFDLLLGYAVSEDGALHAEKFYRTVREEFAATRPAFRWRQVVALARVTASEYGQPAPGYAEACALLKV